MLENGTRFAWVHNPQALDRNLYMKGDFGNTQDLFSSSGIRAGKGFPARRKKNASRRGRGTVVLKLKSLWSYCRADGGSGR